MNSHIRKRSRNIIFSNMGTFALVAVVETAINQFFLRYDIENFFLSAVLSLIYTVVGMGISCFYFRAYNRGKPKAADVFFLFTEKSDKTKLLLIILIQYALSSVVRIAADRIALMGPLMLFAAAVVSVLSGSLIQMLPFLYIANPTYPTAFYFSALPRYLLPEVMRYIFFVLVTGIPRGILLIIASVFLAFLPVIGLLTVIFLLLAFRAYIGTACAGFISSVIPDEWYAGTRTF